MRCGRKFPCEKGHTSGHMITYDGQSGRNERSVERGLLKLNTGELGNYCTYTRVVPVGLFFFCYSFEL